MSACDTNQPLPDTKTALLTIWSAQAEQAKRLLDAGLNKQAAQASMMMLMTLKWEIENLIQNTPESWFTGMPDDKRIQNVIENDFGALQRRLLANT